MTTREFMSKFESELDVAPGTLEPSMALTDVPKWDSLAALLFMAAADEHLGVEVSGDQIAECKTVHDLLALLSEQLTE